jgi:hypothetical protein
MKRWIIFLGRGGTVLIAIGLALFLVSLIPPAQTGGFMGGEYVAPKTFRPLSYFEHISTLTPQQGLKIKMTFNGTLNVYLLEVSTQTLYDWISTHHPEQNMTYPDFFNVTRLEEFLEANPNSISWQAQMLEGTVEYTPTKVTNATLILANPSSDYIMVDYEGSITTLVAPGTKVRNLALWTIPIGFVFALPWLIDAWRTKVRQ